MKISGIYKIQSIKKPERCYIGSAVNISKRWLYHLEDLRKNKHHSIKLQRHYNKYAESDLQFSILLGCEREDLLKTEQYFIDSYNPYFNSSKTAGSRLGIKVSPETRERIRLSKKGFKLSPESIAKIVAKTTGQKRHPHTEETKRKIGQKSKGRIPWNRGIPQTAEAKEKNRNSNIGQKRTKEQLEKMSISHKGKKLTSQHRENIKKSWIIRKLKKVS